MVLSDSEKTAITSLWGKIAPEANNIGAEAMERLFQNHPETKSYFGRFDLSPGSKDLLTHGGKIINALGEAAKNLDNLSKYQDLHTNKLKVNVNHMKLLCGCIQEILASRFPAEYVQAAWEKFLGETTAILTST
ncbi:hemoglobin heart muscle subunit alpha-type-like [Pseudophryne corroboree]|uniref:hemoglobin heart muscle subunit alpha-type-like n=1 Tax=Pseudophryne corroboree TaxID=495146 RepID=UPI003081DE5C